MVARRWAMSWKRHKANSGGARFDGEHEAVRSVVRVARTVREDGSIGATKNRIVRRVPVAPELRSELLRLAPALAGARWSEALIQRPRGGRLSVRAASEVLRRAFAAAGVSGASSHSLRRSWAVLAMRRGVSLAVIRDVLGHRSVAATDRYLRSVQWSEMEAAVRLGGLSLDGDGVDSGYGGER